MMIPDDRQHEFWIAREGDGRYVCGDALNLTRAHGETPRSAMERHLGTLQARARSLNSILAGNDAEAAHAQLAGSARFRVAQILVRPGALEDEIADIVRSAQRE